MECNEKTWDLFSKNKCGLISLSKEKVVHDTLSGDFLFFYPLSNKLTLNKNIGRDSELNMPIVNTKNSEKEWVVNSNADLEKALTQINNK